MANQSGSFGSFLLKALVLLVVIAVGVFAGFWISAKTGLTNAFSSHEPPMQTMNRSNVKVGDMFPPVTVKVNGEETDIRTLLGGKRSMVAFVSGTCEPCQMLVGDLPSWEMVTSGDLQVLLLTRTPEAYGENPAFAVCELPTEVLQQLEVNVFPTFYLVNEAGEVRVATSGYGEAMTEEMLTREL